MSDSTVTMSEDRVTILTGDLRSVFRRGDDEAAAGQIAILHELIERLEISKQGYIDDCAELISENAKLKREVERLREECIKTETECDRLYARVNELEAEAAKEKGE